MEVLNIFAFSNVILMFTSGIVIILTSLYSKGKQSLLKALWILFNFSVFLWGVGGFFMAKATNEVDAAFWARIGLYGVAFTSVFFFHVASVLSETKHSKFILSVIYLQGIFASIANAFHLLTQKMYFVFNSFYYPLSENIIYPIVYSTWILIIVYAEILLFKAYSRSSGMRRLQLLYFLIGTLIGFLGGAINFLLVYNIQIYPYSNFLIAVYCIIATYAILKYRLMDVRVFISRAAAFLISYPIFLSIPFIFAYRMYGVIYPLLGVHWWLVPAVLIVFFASLAPLAYGQLRIRMEERLLAEQKRYQKLLLQAASGMATEHNLNRLLKLIVYIVKRVVKIEFAAIFLDDKSAGVYCMKAFRDTKVVPSKSITFLYEHHFIRYLVKHKEPCLYEELPAAIRQSLRALSGTALIVPSAVQNNLFGFVILGAKLNKQPYSEDDINVFKILSNQAALAIENSLFMEETKQAQEKIFTAEKLASIGGMADGVAHQIKNRLNHFSVASGELKYEIKNFLSKHPEVTKDNKDLKKTLNYLIEIADSLIANVKRTDGIIKGILNFARVEENSTFFSNFSLKEVIDLALELLKIKHEIAQAPIELNLGASDSIYGVKAQLTEAVYNLLDNAYEATEEKRILLAKEGNNSFVPLIRVKLSHMPSKDVLEISDNGIGMREENKLKVFAPFFTTKSSYKSGTGIGMYVVKRMIEENHKGKVYFNSSYMKGTKFFVELPKRGD